MNSPLKLSRVRVAVQIVVHALLAGHVLAYYVLGWRSIGALDFQSFFHHLLGDGVLTAGALLAIVVYGTALVAGRLFCSWGCHFGATQDLAAWILRRLGWRPPLLRTRLLHYTPFLLLGAIFLWPVAERWLASGFAYRGSDFAKVGPWDTLPGWAGTIAAFGLCGAGILLFLGTRGFCRFICPYGAIFRVTDKIAPFRVRKVAPCPGGCGGDDAPPCTAACPTAIDVHAETSARGVVSSADCVRCNLCIEACPSHALAHVTGAQAARRLAGAVVEPAAPGQSLRLLNVPIRGAAAGPVPAAPAPPPARDLPWWGELVVLACAVATYACVDLVHGGHFVAAALAFTEGFLVYLVVQACRGKSAATVWGMPLRRGRTWTLAGVTLVGVLCLSWLPIFEAGAFKVLRAQGLRLDPAAVEDGDVESAALPALAAGERRRLGAAAERYRAAIDYNPRDAGTRKLLVSAYARLQDPRLAAAAEELHRLQPSPRNAELLEWARKRMPAATRPGPPPVDSR